MGSPAFKSEPDPENPGWRTWEMHDASRYNGHVLGKMLVRPGDPGKAWVRMFPEHRHSNMSDNLHGGTLLGFIDVALFAAARIFGLIDVGPAVTLDLSAQFIGPGRVGIPLDAEVELLRETGRLLFLRGIAMQEDARICAFAATIRKATKR